MKSARDETAGQLQPVCVSPDDAARVIGVSRTKIFDLLNAGEIRSFKHGKHRLIPVDQIRAWAAAQLAKSSSEA